MSPIYKLLLPIIIVAGLAITVLIANEGRLLPAYHGETHGDDDDDDGPSGEHTAGEIMSGRFLVHMPKEIQARANLQLLRLMRAEHRDETHALARIVDIQSLLELRLRYREAETEKNIAQATLQISGQEFERLKLLRSEASNISERQLQQARLEWMSNQSHLQSAEVKMDNLRNQLIQGWGPLLTEAILNGSDLAENLFARRSVLLLVTLEGGRLLPANTDSILVNVHGNREQTQAAFYISPAAFTDNRIYGQTYFFHTSANAALRMGAYLDAWIPAGKASQEGVYIPPAAVIWYADKPWVYVKSGADTFARREVRVYSVTRDGWFVRDGFSPDEEIVLYGGQMLLSEEFRWSIPDEDDNP